MDRLVGGLALGDFYRRFRHALAEEETAAHIRAADPKLDPHLREIAEVRDSTLKAVIAHLDEQIRSAKR